MLRYVAGSAGRQQIRVRFAGDQLNGRSTAGAGQMTVYRLAEASWYNDGGNTACGFHAGLGVANRTLPCGTKVAFRYGGRSVTATVDDRGPYVGGRDWDLNQNTAAALGFGGVGTVWSASNAATAVRHRRPARPSRRSGVPGHLASAAMADRCVAHLDMDAFYVSVELRRRPELRGRPVIVAGTGPRSVVTTASYEARRFGVGSAMPAARARRLCPDGVFLPPDFAYYRETSREVMASVRGLVDAVEVIGLDEAYLDLTGLPAPHAAMRRLGRRHRTGTTGLGCSIGIGPNKLVAKVASDAEKPRGFVVLTREQACERFGTSRCGLVPGIGPKTAERLRTLGIETLAALANAPYEQLAPHFGARLAAELQRRARFEDSSPVTEERKVVSESRETTFDEDIADPGELEAILDELVGRCAPGSSPSAGGGGRSGSRSGSTTSRPTPGRAPSPRPSARPTGWVRSRSICCGGSRRPGRFACSGYASPASSCPGPPPRTSSR